MDHALVVLDTDATGRALLEEAGRLAAGAGARLSVLSLLSPEEYTEKREALEAAAREEHTSYDTGAVLDRARQDAEEIAEDVFGDLDLEWEGIGARVTEGETEAERILGVASERDYDHLFITGHRRSPTGKAVFGDRAQSLILNFDGPVTTLLD
jgi:nucleotide-binding universal stress UspA family protein